MSLTITQTETRIFVRNPHDFRIQDLLNKMKGSGLFPLAELEEWEKKTFPVKDRPDFIPTALCVLYYRLVLPLFDQNEGIKDFEKQIHALLKATVVGRSVDAFLEEYEAKLAYYAAEQFIDEEVAYHKQGSMRQVALAANAVNQQLIQSRDVEKDRIKEAKLQIEKITEELEAKSLVAKIEGVQNVLADHTLQAGVLASQMQSAQNRFQALTQEIA